MGRPHWTGAPDSQVSQHVVPTSACQHMVSPSHPFLSLFSLPLFPSLPSSDAVLKCQSSPIRSPFVKDAPVSPSAPLPIPVPPPISPSVLHPIPVPPPVPPPIPPREPSDASPPAVLCSVCGQEIKELPRNEEGGQTILLVSSSQVVSLCSSKSVQAAGQPY